MDEDIRLLRLVILLLRGPHTVAEISEALEVSAWGAYWYLRRLRSIAPFVPGLRGLRRTAPRTYSLAPAGCPDNGRHFATLNKPPVA
jgi:predicted DNA-binding transcriptional regulator YafY